MITTAFKAIHLRTALRTCFSQKISLGIKQLSDDPWEALTKDLATGLPISGKITRVVSFGLFVELENGLEEIGRAHV